MPLSNPKHTLINPIKVITKIIINLLEKLSVSEKIYDSPELICSVPRPKDVVTPNTVVSIATISIKIDRGLLLETFEPSKELTLNGSFLLYDANAKQSPSKEYIAHP